MINELPMFHVFSGDYPRFPCSFGVRQVDETNFRPDADILRSRILSNNLGSSTVGVFDFPDGKDTGYRPFRDIGADVTEIQAESDRIEKSVADTQEAKRRKDEARKDLSDAFQSALGVEPDVVSEVVSGE